MATKKSRTIRLLEECRYGKKGKPIRYDDIHYEEIAELLEKDEIKAEFITPKKNKQKDDKPEYVFAGLPLPSRPRQVNIVKELASVSTQSDDPLSSTRIGYLYLAELDSGARRWVLWSPNRISLGERSNAILDYVSSDESSVIFANLETTQLRSISKERRSHNKRNELEDDEVRAEVFSWLPSVLIVFSPAYTRSQILEAAERLKQNGLEYVHGILTHGFTQFDESLFRLMPAFVLEHSTQMQPRLGMKTSPHSIIVTGTKAGKSTAAETITGQPTSNKTTQAGLFGYTSEGKILTGQLHERRRPFFIDEPGRNTLQENIGEAMLAVMENGTAQVSAGRQHEIKTTSPLVTLSNPKVRVPEGTIVTEQQKGSLYAEKLSDLLTLFTDNTEAYGSRVGVLLFDPDSAQISGGYSSVRVGNEIYHEDELAFHTLRSLAESYAEEFSDATRRCASWFEDPFPDDYITAVEGITARTGFAPLKEFLHGHRAAHRHARGVAFRLAFLETKVRSLGGSDEEMLKNADKHFEFVLRTNLRGFKTAVNIAGNAEVVRILARTELESLKPYYLRLFVETVFEYVRASEKKIERYISIPTLEASFSEVRKRRGITRESTTNYTTWSRVFEPIEARKERLHWDLKPFGLSYNRALDALVIDDPNLFRHCLEAYEAEHQQDQQHQQDQPDQLQQQDQQDQHNSASRRGQNSSVGDVGVLVKDSVGSFLASRGSGSVLTIDQIKDMTSLNDGEIREAMKAICERGDAMPHHSGADVWEVL